MSQLKVSIATKSIRHKMPALSSLELHGSFQLSTCLHGAHEAADLALCC